MRPKTLSTVLGMLLFIALALPVAADDGTQPPESALQVLVNAITAWFGEIAGEVEAVSGGLPENAATSGANDGGQAELGPIIFPGG